MKKHDEARRAFLLRAAVAARIADSGVTVIESLGTVEPDPGHVVAVPTTHVVGLEVEFSVGCLDDGAQPVVCGREKTICQAQRGGGGEDWCRE